MSCDEKELKEWDKILSDPKIRAAQQVFLDNAMKALKHVQTRYTPQEVFAIVKARVHRLPDPHSFDQIFEDAILNGHI